jgi:hypothetical protein
MMKKKEYKLGGSGAIRRRLAQDNADRHGCQRLVTTTTFCAENGTFTLGLSKRLWTIR